jgi:hypothetical protein
MDILHSLHLTASSNLPQKPSRLARSSNHMPHMLLAVGRELPLDVKTQPNRLCQSITMGSLLAALLAHPVAWGAAPAGTPQVCVPPPQHLQHTGPAEQAATTYGVKTPRQCQQGTVSACYTLIQHDLPVCR